MKIRTRLLLGILTVVALVVIAGLVYFNFPPPGKGGVTGRYWSQDDTGLPDTFATEGSFLVVPGVTVREVWPDEAETAQDPRFTDLSVKFDFEELQEKYGATLAEVQFNGRFRVLAPQGPAVICLIDLFMRGCRELELPESGSLRATRGEGGFWIEVK